MRGAGGASMLGRFHLGNETFYYYGTLTGFNSNLQRDCPMHFKILLIVENEDQVASRNFSF